MKSRTGTLVRLVRRASEKFTGAGGGVGARGCGASGSFGACGVVESVNFPGMGWGLRSLTGVLTVLVGAGVGGCGLVRQRAGAGAGDGVVEDMRRGRRPMGQVMVVDEAKRFVLVRSPLAASAPAESTLVVKSPSGAATTGRIKVSPERDRSRLAADIVEGAPKLGDIVFFETREKVISMEPPPGGGGEVGAGVGASGVVRAAGDGAGAAGVAAEAGAKPAVPSGEPAAGSGAGGAAELPPLGEPSGPREAIPDFPGLEPLPEGGRPPGVGGLPEALPEPGLPDA